MSEKLSYWEHLDELRDCLIRIIIAILITGVASFFMKELVFDVVLAPCHSDFCTYRLFGADDFSLHLINTGLAEQMMIHLKVAFCTGILFASPYIIYVLFGFVSPALYEKERRYSFVLISFAYVMFLVGVLFNYFLIFPLTLRFLGSYHISEDIDNMLTISSYIDTMLMMSLMFGLVCEIPVLSLVLAKVGLIRSEWMSYFRRHAIVVILIVAAVITPTADVFTLFVVALPIWLLYEVSILVVMCIEKSGNNIRDTK